jgi:hypothetical protein
LDIIVILIFLGGGGVLQLSLQVGYVASMAGRSMNYELENMGNRLKCLLSNILHWFLCLPASCLKT